MNITLGIGGIIVVVIIAWYMGYGQGKADGRQEKEQEIEDSSDTN